MNHKARMQLFNRAGLYLATSEDVSGGRPTLEIVKAALEGGLLLLQLREKNMPLKDFMSLAHEVRRLTNEHGALLIINDRPDVAMACNADGVHLGQDDFPVEEARQVAPEMIIGASSHNLDEALEAQSKGASYVNIGPLFPTNTKSWHGEFLGLNGLRSIAPSLHIPFTVMGGIKLNHVEDLVVAGARTLAIITAVTMEPDPKAAVQEWIERINIARNQHDAI